MKKLLFFLSFAGVIACILQSCENNYIAEPLDPRLPAYSEVGAGDAGAYIDGNPWRTGNEFQPFASPFYAMRLHYSLDSVTTSTRISFLRGPVFNLGKSATIVFYLLDERISDRSELERLEGTKFNLSEGGSYAHLIFHRRFVNDTLIIPEDTLVSTKGAFYIRNVEYKKESERTIISGTFGFETEEADSAVKVSSGRYDFSLDQFDYRPF
jgi:hypothetical protein